MSTEETQQALAFAAMCVDLVAKAEGCSRHEMYMRMKKQDLFMALQVDLMPYTPKVKNM